jgi:hypothetical protein
VRHPGEPVRHPGGPVSGSTAEAASPSGTHDGAPPEDTAGRPWLTDALWVLGTFVGLGVLGAVAWWLLADPAVFTKTKQGGLSMGEVQLARQFGTDGWYIVVAFVLGVLAGGVLTWWRSRDFLLTSGLLLVGSLVAAAVMSLLGRVLGPADPSTLVGTVPVGGRLPTQLEVTAQASYLMGPIAVLAGALFVLWSPPAERTEPSPGAPPSETVT